MYLYRNAIARHHAGNLQQVGEATTQFHQLSIGPATTSGHLEQSARIGFTPTQNSIEKVIRRHSHSPFK
jgi:hypothetical protein